MVTGATPVLCSIVRSPLVFNCLAPNKGWFENRIAAQSFSAFLF
jgi:hypothetical protein